MSLKKQNWVPAKHFSAAILRLIFFDLFAAHSPLRQTGCLQCQKYNHRFVGQNSGKMARWLFSYRSQQVQTRGEYIHHRYIVKTIILCFHNIVKISVLHHNIAISTKFLWNCFSDFFCLYPPEKSFLRPKATQESPLVVKKILWSSKNSLKKGRKKLPKKVVTETKSIDR